MEKKGDTPEEISRDEILKLMAQKSLEKFYTLEGLIGEGGFGKVYKAKKKGDDKFYAVKILLKPPTRSDINESLIMSKIKCEFLLSSDDFFINSDEKSYP